MIQWVKDNVNSLVNQFSTARHMHKQYKQLTQSHVRDLPPNHNLATRLSNVALVFAQNVTKQDKYLGAALSSHLDHLSQSATSQPQKLRKRDFVRIAHSHHKLLRENERIEKLETKALQVQEADKASLKTIMQGTAGAKSKGQYYAHLCSLAYLDKILPNQPIPKPEDSSLGIPQYSVSKVIEGEFGLRVTVLIPSGGEKGPPILAFRGTKQGVIENFADDLQNVIGSKGFQGSRHLILDALKDAQQQTGQKAVVVGHSLGGSLAQLAGVHFPTLIQEVYHFNAPGVGRKAVAEFESMDPAMRPKVHSFRHKGDLVYRAGGPHLSPSERHVVPHKDGQVIGALAAHKLSGIAADIPHALPSPARAAGSPRRIRYRAVLIEALRIGLGTPMTPLLSVAIRVEKVQAKATEEIRARHSTLLDLHSEDKVAERISRLYTQSAAAAA